MSEKGISVDILIAAARGLTKKAKRTKTGAAKSAAVEAIMNVMKYAAEMQDEADDRGGSPDEIFLRVDRAYSRMN